jgi:hypothetical protein
MIDKHFKYEEKVIDVILGLIRDNQEYLTLPENLPQLAKLGFMYNTLWYAGRRCWGYNGILRDGVKRTLTKQEMEKMSYEDEEVGYDDCQDNPKYKIEMCNPIDDDIENFIYDAWGMHVSDDKGFSFADFVKKIKEGRELNDFDYKMLKINKTFDEWVEVLTDPRYQYQYESRKEVACQLMCTIGTSYGLNKSGFIIQEASGADQDEALYGDWENAKFREDIEKVVYAILDIPEVAATVDEDYKSRKKWFDEQEANKQKEYSTFYSTLQRAGLYDETEGKLNWKELHHRLDKVWEKSGLKLSKKETYEPYYPISSGSPIYAIMDQETRDRLGIKEMHESYVKEAIRICQEILEHADIEDKAHHKDNNTKFAKKLLLSQGFTEYAEQVPKEVDKYAIEKEVLRLMKPITSTLTAIDGPKNNYTTKKGEYYYYFNNTRDSDYADNSYNFFFNIDTTNLEKGYFNSIDVLKPMPWYKELKTNLEEIKKLESVSGIDFYFDNPAYNDGINRNGITIKVNTKYSNASKIKFENDLIKENFQIGSFFATFKLNDAVTLVTAKPECLGVGHPDFKTGKECYSKAKTFEAYDTNWKKICSFHIDERGFNSISANHGTKTDLSKWIVTQHKAMKQSNKDYYSGGYSKGEGKEKLYTHDLFIWLKNHQNEQINNA